jgi:hypothetical protein
VSNSPSRLVSRLAQLERARTAKKDAVKVVIQFTDSDPAEIEKQVADAAATGATVVLIRSLGRERS